MYQQRETKVKIYAVKHLRPQTCMGMGKPDVCRIDALSLPIPAARSIIKNDKVTMRRPDCGTDKNEQRDLLFIFRNDLEYWVSGDDVTTFEYVNAGGETARRVQGDSYNPDASYEYMIKNHLGSTMMTVNENGVLSGSIYDYFTLR